jgi:hypothetical protein
LIDRQVVGAAVEIQKWEFVGPAGLRREPRFVASPQRKPQFSLPRADRSVASNVLDDAFSLWLGEGKVESLPLHAHDATADLWNEYQLERPSSEVPRLPPFMAGAFELDTHAQVAHASVHACRVPDRD